MTETNVLEIVLVDDSNYEKTLRLDNPVDNVTLAVIRQKFATAISEGWLLGKSGTPVILVARASKVVTQKTSVE